MAQKAVALPKRFPALRLRHELVVDLTAEEWASVRALRLIIIGGQATLAERAEKFRKRTNGRIELMNTYGPTETTIVATMSKIVGQTT